MTLATYFTTMVPAMLQPPPQEQVTYQDAARLLERERRASSLSLGAGSGHPGRNSCPGRPGRPGTTTPLRP
jgi:hypothetical protein